MLDGVGWAALEIAIFMVAATLIGFAIGWVFVGWLQRSSIAREYEAELTAQQELAKKAEYRLSEGNRNLDKLHLELKGEHQKVGELEAQLESMQASVDELSNSSSTADTSVELASVTEALAAAQTDLSKVEAELDTCAAGRDDLSTRVGDLESALADRESRIAELEADLAAALLEPEPVADAAPASGPAALLEREPAVAAAPATDAAAIDVAPTKEQGLARIAAIAARTSGGAPAADDDLKKVHGIGPKLERTLKGLGITSFRQIANFQPDDIVFVTAALDAFKGRIVRDDWMGSAAAEHANKYNEPV